MIDWLIMKAEKLYSVFSHRIKNLELDELEQD